MAIDQMIRKAQLAAELAHLVLEQKPQRLDRAARFMRSGSPPTL
jgi:hypothetical protein